MGEVNFPDSMSEEDIRKHSGRLHQIANISTRTGSVDVTRSLPFAQKAITRGDNDPALAHFVSQAEQSPDGRDRVDFATGRHTLKALPSDGRNFERSEFRKLLQEDLTEATSRAGTRADWLDVDKPERNSAPLADTRKSSPIISALQQRAAERTQLQ